MDSLESHGGRYPLQERTDWNLYQNAPRKILHSGSPQATSQGPGSPGVQNGVKVSDLALALPSGQLVSGHEPSCCTSFDLPTVHLLWWGEHNTRPPPSSLSGPPELAQQCPFVRGPQSALLLLSALPPLTPASLPSTQPPAAPAAAHDRTPAPGESSRNCSSRLNSNQAQRTLDSVSQSAFAAVIIIRKNGRLINRVVCTVLEAENSGSRHSGD